ncbi:MAG: PQQ-binding-like beta-propeller repeat protein [Alphaproteobacteria bacterium]|nr:PQQ-binding-like beta-propeller repeat protein [Alphaproteobacteria bacterium]
MTGMPSANAFVYPLVKAASFGLILGALTGCVVGETISNILVFSDPPLPGERIAVLTDQELLMPDAQLADERVVLPPPSMEDEWPQQGGSPAHVMAHGILSDSPEQVWSRDIGRGSDSDETLLAGPVLAGGIVYTIDNNAEVAAYDADNGQEIWRTETELRGERDGGWGGGLAVDQGLVVVTTGFGQVIALDAGNGGEIWRTSVGGPMRSSPTIDRGRIFAMTRDNKLHALSLETGDMLWEHRGGPVTAGLLGTSSPAIYGDVVLAAYSSGELFALDVEDGTEFWDDSLAATGQTATVSTISDIRARPVISGRNAYVSSNSGRLAAYVLTTSQQLWELETGTTTQPWVAGDYLFVTTTRGEVAAIKADSGLIKWVTRIGEFKNERRQKNPISWSGPILAGDRLIVAGSTGEVLSLSPYTGDLLSTMRIRGGVTLSPILARETLYFLTDSGRLLAYR